MDRSRETGLYESWIKETEKDLPLPIRIVDATNVLFTHKFLELVPVAGAHTVSAVANVSQSKMEVKWGGSVEVGGMRE